MLTHTYTSIIEAGRSVAYKNGVPLDVAMLWVRQAIASGHIVIVKNVNNVSHGYPLFPQSE